MNGDEIAAMEVYSKKKNKSGATASRCGSAKESTKASDKKEELSAEDGQESAVKKVAKCLRRGRLEC